MDWNQFAKEVHQVAVKNGYWNHSPSITEQIVLMHAELSKAVLAQRAGTSLIFCAARKTNAACTEEPCGGVDCLKEFPGRKPEGVAVEMADCILLILDTMAANHLTDKPMDLQPQPGYFVRRDDLIQTVSYCHYLLAHALHQADRRPGSEFMSLMSCIEVILNWAKQNDVDMELLLLIKHEYNKNRQ